jgi:hypothetical protein
VISGGAADDAAADDDHFGMGGEFAGHGCDVVPWFCLILSRFKL